jgi:hypothetical protein
MCICAGVWQPAVPSRCLSVGSSGVANSGSDLAQVPLGRPYGTGSLCRRDSRPWRPAVCADRDRDRRNRPHPSRLRLSDLWDAHSLAADCWPLTEDPSETGADKRGKWSTPHPGTCPLPLAWVWVQPQFAGPLSPRHLHLHLLPDQALGVTFSPPGRSQIVLHTRSLLQRWIRDVWQEYAASRRDGNVHVAGTLRA